LRDGAELWCGDVPGRAYGLALANGRLLVSTSEGAICCFVPGEVEPEHVVRNAPNPSPYAEDDLSKVYACAADAILKQTGVKKGYALVLGCGEGRLAYELARRTDLNLIGVERDPAKVAVARAALDAAGLYGVRVTVHEWNKDVLPYTSCLANLIVSDETLITGTLSIPAKEVLRILCPCGGVACIGQPSRLPRKCLPIEPAALERWSKDGGVPEARLEKNHGLWALIRRGPVPDSGEWTQLYANANHTACSMDQLRGPMEIQWFGAPGPREIIDRHHRPMSPLYKDGRVFVPADNKIIAADAYNGTPLWELAVPDSRRAGALKSGGHMLVAGSHIYIAFQSECWDVDVATGDHASTIKAPQLCKDPHDWGVLDYADDVLIGTGQKAGASFSDLSKNTVSTLEGDFRPSSVLTVFLLRSEKEAPAF